jgi:hypothetical protein
MRGPLSLVVQLLWSAALSRWARQESVATEWAQDTSA